MKSIRIFLCMSFKLSLLALINVMIRKSGLIDFYYFPYFAIGWCVNEFSQMIFDIIWHVFVIW